MKKSLLVLSVLTIFLVVVAGLAGADPESKTVDSFCSITVDEIILLDIEGDHNYHANFTVEPSDWPSRYKYADFYDNFVEGGPEDAHYLTVQALCDWVLAVEKDSYGNPTPVEWIETEVVRADFRGNAGGYTELRTGSGALAWGGNTAGSYGASFKVKQRLDLRDYQGGIETGMTYNLDYVLTAQ